jgi:hypothetical protein
LKFEGAKQQYAAEIESPYIEVSFDLESGEDAEHKLITFCGLEEIPPTTKLCMMSAFHSLLTADVSKCLRKYTLK